MWDPEGAILVELEDALGEVEGYLNQLVLSILSLVCSNLKPALLANLGHSRFSIRTVNTNPTFSNFRIRIFLLWEETGLRNLIESSNRQCRRD